MSSVFIVVWPEKAIFGADPLDSLHGTSHDEAKILRIIRLWLADPPALLSSSLISSFFFRVWFLKRTIIWTSCLLLSAHVQNPTPWAPIINCYYFSIFSQKVSQGWARYKLEISYVAPGIWTSYFSLSIDLQNFVRDEPRASKIVRGHPQFIMLCGFRHFIVRSYLKSL